MTKTSDARKLNIALVAHDAKKNEMVQWVEANLATLSRHALYSTGTTGQRIIDATGLDISRLLSGPLGGDQQLGAMIAEGRIDVLIFFCDPLTAVPHDVDVKALLRISVLHDTALATNARTATLILRALGCDADAGAQAS